MPTIRINFAGLFLMVRHPRNGRDMSGGMGAVTALAVDATQRGENEPREHLDGSSAVPHVGYVRIPLKYLDRRKRGSAVKGLTDKDEIVLRLNHEEIRLEGASTGDQVRVPDQEKHRLPNTVDLGDFTPFRLRSDCLAKRANDDVLARFVLRGGQFIAPGTTFPCSLRDIRGGGTANLERQSYSNQITWEVGMMPENETAELHLAPFGWRRGRSIRLRPVDGVIEIDLANACKDNPLNWDELSAMRVDGNDDLPADHLHDLDFKWHYRLLENPGRDLPVPEGDEGHGFPDIYHCMHAAIDGPPLD